MKSNVNQKKVVAVIPARLGSTRFPGKPLKPILGLPMIEHVRRRALLCGMLDDVIVATCDQEILQVVQANGGKAVMTSPAHERCTDRVEEAVKDLECDIVVILQGDEPLFNPQVVEMIVSPMLADEKIDCVNLLSAISNRNDLSDPDIVKAALDQKKFILFYSRSPIPYLRTNDPQPPLYRQTGISAFSKSFLRQFSALVPTPLEAAESVDFLRILEHRFPILGVVYNAQTVGVDQPDDISLVEDILRHDPQHKRLYEEILAL